MKLDLITIIALFMVFGSLIFGIFYYFNMTNNACVSNPLVYSAKYYEDIYKPYKVVGSLTILGDKNMPPKVYYYNSKNVSEGFLPLY